MQRPLTRVSAAELETYYQAGHFPPGNMGPKVESVLRFLRGGGKLAVITSYNYLCDAIAGISGTQVMAIEEPKRSTKPMQLAGAA
jgi:carbamate kinase